MTSNETATSGDTDSPDHESHAYSSIVTLLPEEFFILRSHVPAKSSRTVLFPLAFVLYAIGVVSLALIYLSESQKYTLQTVVSTEIIADPQWTCAMASSVSKTVPYSAVPATAATSVTAVTVDLVNILDIDSFSEPMLQALQPCALSEASVKTNSTAAYSIGGWLSSVAPYATDDVVFLAIATTLVSPALVGYSINMFDRASGRLVPLFEAGVFDQVSFSSAACRVTYVGGIAAVPSQALPRSWDVYFVYNNVFYVTAAPVNGSATATVANDDYVACATHGVPASFYRTFVTNDNAHDVYLLAVQSNSQSALQQAAVYRLQRLNRTQFNATRLLSLHQTPIFSFAVHTAPNGTTSVFYATCTGLFRWQTGGHTAPVGSFAASFARSAQGANSFNFINVQLNAQTQQLYLSNLNTPLVVELNASVLGNTSLFTAPMATSPCPVYGGAIAVLPDGGGGGGGGRLLCSCNVPNRATTMALNTYDQFVFVDAARVSVSVLAAGYNTSVVGWYLCGGQLQRYLPYGLPEERANCSANGLAWRSTYLGEQRFFTAADAAAFFVDVARAQCNASQLYPFVAATVGRLPPYLCSQRVRPTVLAALATAVADAKVVLLVLLLLCSLLLSRFGGDGSGGDGSTAHASPSLSPSTTPTEVAAAPAASATATASASASASADSFERLFFPAQFYFLPYAPIAEAKLSVVVALAAAIAAVCVAAFALLVTTSAATRTEQSQLSLVPLAPEGGWTCALATTLTQLEYSTPATSPQETLSYVNVNELSGPCLDTLVAVDPCETALVYVPPTVLPLGSPTFVFQSAYASELLFTALEATGSTTVVFAVWNVTSGVVRRFDCEAYVGIPGNMVAQGPGFTGYLPPVTTTYAAVFDQNCRAIPVHNVPSKWTANTVTNDQRYTLYAASGKSLYRLTPRAYDAAAAAAATSFNATLVVTVAQWVAGSAAVHFNATADAPVVFYVASTSSSLTLLARYAGGATTTLQAPYRTNVPVALNPSGTRLYVVTNRNVLHAYDVSRGRWPAASTTAAALTPLTALSSVALASAVDDATLWLSSGAAMVFFDVATNASAAVAKLSPGPRVGWATCGANATQATLPSSLAAASAACAADGLWWQLAYEDTYYATPAAMQRRATAAARDRCAAASSAALYASLCAPLNATPPYVCNRRVAPTLAATSTAALATSQLLFALLCVAGAAALVALRSARRSAAASAPKSSTPTPTAATVSDALLPAAFFWTKAHRRAKAPRRWLWAAWAVAAGAAAALFATLVATQRHATSTEVSVAATDRSGSGGWTCAPSATVTATYSTPLVASYAASSVAAESVAVEVGATLLVAVAEAYDDCLAALTAADPCDAATLDDAWQFGYGAAQGLSDFAIYASAYAAGSDVLYATNGLAVPLRYDLAHGQLAPAVNCPLATFLAANGELTGAYVGVSGSVDAVFLGAAGGLVTFDCAAVAVVNVSSPSTASASAAEGSPLFAAGGAGTAAVVTLPSGGGGGFPPGRPHVLTTETGGGPRGGRVVVCANSSATHRDECYRLRFANATHATTSAADVVFRSTEPLAVFAACRRVATANATANATAAQRFVAYTMTTVPGLWLAASVASADGDADDAPLSPPLAVLLLQTPSWLQFDDECAHLFYVDGDVYRVDLVATVDAAAAAAAASVVKTAVVTVGAVVTFALVGTANASRTAAVLFSTNEAGYAFYYWQNLTASAEGQPTLQPPAIVYTGYQASLLQWMTCGNATVTTATLATPLATAVAGAAVCPANGVAAQWQFQAQYVYPAALMQRFMVRASVETYCATPAQRQALYASLCRTASDQPPFLCSRAVPASLLTVLSVGAANAGFAYEALTLLLGVLLPWAVRCWQRQRQRQRQAARAVEADDAEAPSQEAAVEMTATVTVANPLHPTSVSSVSSSVP